MPLRRAGFGIKVDAIPGLCATPGSAPKKTGDFYGQCQQASCGKEHAYMPIHVKVVTAEEYAAVDVEKKKTHPENGTALGLRLQSDDDRLIFAALFATYGGTTAMQQPTGAQLFDLPLV